MSNMKHQRLTDKIIGIFYDVYNELGKGFIESIYEKAMCIALTEAGLSFERQKSASVYFRGHNIGNFKLDLIVEGLILLELKAASKMIHAHEAQAINYLRATDLEVGLLLNFGDKPTFKRLVFDNEFKQNLSTSEPCKSV